MTYYEYAGEMGDLCLKISQRLKAMKQKGLYDFYYAASEGFDVIRKNMNVEEAEMIVDKDQMEQLESTAAYEKEVRKEAVEYISQEVTA